ncbi:HAMP domain-containing sensor histidine kinase [Amylibacter sp. IMCC11727]|uniref:sensor histidine kinase n=1 Tax=Amylibacter sp. IMCC11727 TaxID=3039851 RepID=UPI00244DB579|nr:HAMP domain-containing sensor histidine kinase [Amylibacter sp. IMCC11727]WGI21683.1 HAMP domain-containing sensor histidine kinase [Amylibacter sp. IMCC11727]
MFLKSLSGRFLLLTIVFVMLAEVLIFVPSVARFRVDYLQERLERSQIASLSLLATANDMVEPELEAELLENAGVLNIVLRRDSIRELVLASPMPAMIEESFDLRDPSAWVLIKDAFRTMVPREDRVIRVLGQPVKGAGLMIEVAMDEAPLRAALWDYGLTILILSAVISAFTAALLFFSVRTFMVRPIERLVRQIKNYEEAPEDARRIIQPKATVTEIYEAETALNSMETQLSQSLRQKERLAALGGAVSKISHDLRNILTTTQLLADRMEHSDDPRVQKSAPKLLNSLSRAVNLCESTLAFGKAEEAAPMLRPVSMQALFDDVVEAETLALQDGSVEVVAEDVSGIEMQVDEDQIYRVVSNLVRNARQVLAAGKGGEVRVSGAESENGWTITVKDTGPGLPPKALDNIFKPFEGSVRKGGTGLGLAVSADLVSGHGGKLELVENSSAGAAFQIWLPK